MADYGYKGDWLIEKIILAVDVDTYRGKSAEEILQVVHIYRNNGNVKSYQTDTRGKLSIFE
uniref:hypothetical protein n=1 Tax=Bacillus cereus TaxID=1396 RepID=UPI00285265B2|nr:hypothetical protein [Bacillus cereus]